MSTADIIQERDELRRQRNSAWHRIQELEEIIDDLRDQIDSYADNSNTPVQPECIATCSVCDGNFQLRQCRICNNIVCGDCSIGCNCGYSYCTDQCAEQDNFIDGMTCAECLKKVKD